MLSPEGRMPHIEEEAAEAMSVEDFAMEEEKVAKAMPALRKKRSLWKAISFITGAVQIMMMTPEARAGDVPEESSAPQYGVESLYSSPDAAAAIDSEVDPIEGGDDPGEDEQDTQLQERLKALEAKTKAMFEEAAEEADSSDDEAEGGIEPVESPDERIEISDDAAWMIKAWGGSVSSSGIKFGGPQGLEITDTTENLTIEANGATGLDVRCVNNDGTTDIVRVVLKRIVYHVNVPTPEGGGEK